MDSRLETSGFCIVKEVYSLEYHASAIISVYYGDMWLLKSAPWCAAAGPCAAPANDRDVSRETMWGRRRVMETSTAEPLKRGERAFAFRPLYPAPLLRKCAEFRLWTPASSDSLARFLCFEGREATCATAGKETQTWASRLLRTDVSRETYPSTPRGFEPFSPCTLARNSLQSPL